jgi:hypothetical protein
MPKIIAKYSTTAINTTTSLRERIAPAKAIREKYANTGAPRPLQKPKSDKVSIRPLTLAERMDIDADFNEEMKTSSLLARLDHERSLLERITAKPVALPPVDPAEVPVFEPEIKERDKSLYLKKTNILKRIKETTPIFEACSDRWQPLLDLLNEDDRRTEALVPEEVRAQLWEVYEDFQNAYKQFDKKEGHRWTNKRWNRVIGAMKRFGRIKMVDLKDNYKDICTEICSAKFTFGCEEV